MYINDLPIDINFMIDNNSYRLNIDTDVLTLYQIFESKDDKTLLQFNIGA